jgi:pilus assembly protein Flp/PilA
MLKYYVLTTEAFKRLRADKDGVVSFEYVIVAACVVAAVGLAFGLGGTGPISSALSSSISSITSKVINAVG